MVNITSLEDTPSSLEETLDQEAAPLVQKIDIESPLEQRAVDQQSTILEVPPAELSEARLRVKQLVLGRFSLTVFL